MKNKEINNKHFFGISFISLLSYLLIIKNLINFLNNKLKNESFKINKI